MNRPVICGNCGKEGHNRRSCKKPSPKEGNHLMPWQIQPGGSFWAPYGKKGWSAVNVLDVGRVWAKVERVKPKTGEVVNRKGRVRKDELLVRDPKVNGADRPEEGPDVVFAKFREDRLAAKTKDMEAKAAALVAAPEPVEAAPEPRQEKSPEEQARIWKTISALLDALPDDSTDDDW